MAMSSCLSALIPYGGLRSVIFRVSMPSDKGRIQKDVDSVLPDGGVRDEHCARPTGLTSQTAHLRRIESLGWPTGMINSMLAYIRRKNSVL